MSDQVEFFAKSAEAFSAAALDSLQIIYYQRVALYSLATGPGIEAKLRRDGKVNEAKSQDGVVSDPAHLTKDIP